MTTKTKESSLDHRASKVSNKLHNLFDEEAQALLYLRDRWEDEKDYEDFSEYQNLVSVMFEQAGFSQTNLNKNFTIKTKFIHTEIEIKIYKSGKIKFNWSC